MILYIIALTSLSTIVELSSVFIFTTTVEPQTSSVSSLITTTTQTTSSVSSATSTTTVGPQPTSSVLPTGESKRKQK